MEFVINAADLRRELFAHFAVQESSLRGVVHYLASCRVCHRIVVVMPKPAKHSVQATPLVLGLEHLKTHPKEVVITTKPDDALSER